MSAHAHHTQNTLEHSGANIGVKFRDRKEDLLRVIYCVCAGSILRCMRLTTWMHFVLRIEFILIWPLSMKLCKSIGFAYHFVNVLSEKKTENWRLLISPKISKNNFWLNFSTSNVYCVQFNSRRRYKLSFVNKTIKNTQFGCWCVTNSWCLQTENHSRDS